MNLARIQARLSKGKVYRSRRARLTAEVRDALLIAFGEPAIEAPPDWPISSSFLHAFDELDPLVAPQSGAKYKLDELLPEDQYLSYMLLQDDSKRRKAVRMFTAGSLDLLNRIEGRRSIMSGSSVDMRYRAYAANLFMEHQNFFILIAHGLGHTIEEFRSLGPENLVKLLRDIPTLHVEASIAARLEAQAGSLDANDLRDMLSFYTAIPYSDVLVAEREFVSLALQARLQIEYDVSLLTGLDELIAEMGKE